MHSVVNPKMMNNWFLCISVNIFSGVSMRNYIFVDVQGAILCAVLKDN